jgi:arginine utilization protein RocB
MLSLQQSNNRIIIHRGSRLFKPGTVINVQTGHEVNQYVVLSNEANGDAILEILKDEAVRRIERLINQADDKPKKYRSTYNSKHGRSW